MKKLLLGLFALSVLLFNSCTKEHDGRTSVDDEIDEILAEQMLELKNFALPAPGDYSKIPQSIDNPITADKVALGRSIFWDPVFNQNTFSASNTMTASCGSCHVKDGHAGVAQGFGEGGASTGLTGESRVIDTDNFVNDPSILDRVAETGKSAVEFIDAQPIRAPTNMHVAYKGNALWNGALGNPDVSRLINSDGIVNHNEGIDFPDAFPFDLAADFPGFGGAEMQGLAGLRVHRYKFNEEIINTAGSEYKDLFDEVFVNSPVTNIVGKFEDANSVDNGMFKDRGKILLDGSIDQDTTDDEWVPIQYSRLAAAMAVSAYTRSVLANEAPFQSYINGDHNGMTEQQKRGFKVFLDKKCTNCHNGPALTDADFHAMGTKDLGEANPNIAVRLGNPIGGFVPADMLDIGRQNVTGDEADRGAFMTQTLYNLPLTNFFHGGENIDLEDAIDYMLNAEMNEGKDFVKDPLWTKQTVTSAEKADLVEFIKNGLRDQNFERKYRPGADLVNGVEFILSTDNTANSGAYIKICSPNNDPLSAGGQDAGVICPQ